MDERKDNRKLGIREEGIPERERNRERERRKNGV